jgi:hypothetical protein
MSKIDRTAADWDEHDQRARDDERRRWRFEAACAAMQGLIASCSMTIPRRIDTAKVAIEFADALMTELDKRSGGGDV